MKCRVSGPELAAAVQWVQRTAIASRVTLPALSGIRLTAGVGVVEVAGTDLQVAAAVRVEAEVADQGGALVPAHVIVPVAASVPPVAVDLHTDRDRLVLDHRGGSARVALLPAEDYPPLPVDGAGGAHEIPGSVLAHLLGSVIHAADRGVDTRAVLQAVHLATSGGRLHVEATNSHIYSERSIPWDGPDLDWLLPLRVAESLARSVTGDAVLDEAPTLRGCLVGWGDRRLVTQQVEGRFPDVAAIAGPVLRRVDGTDGSVCVAEVDVDEAVVAIKAAAALADSATVSAHINVAIGDGTVRWEGADPERGSSWRETEAEVTGEPIALGVRAAYLVAALGSLTTPRARIAVRDPLKPFTVRNSAGDEHGPLELIMPVRLC